MTDHLATAQRWLSTAQDSRSFDHLMSAMDQIIAHLEAQQASPQPATAPPAAQQGERGHRDGGEAVQAAMAVLHDEGADSAGGWHSWRCFDRGRYPEPCDCTERVTRAAIAAEPHIRAKIAAEARDALAAAWDEGFREGDVYVFNGLYIQTGNPKPNPYRQEQP